MNYPRSRSLSGGYSTGTDDETSEVERNSGEETGDGASLNEFVEGKGPRPRLLTTPTQKALLKALLLKVSQ